MQNRAISAMIVLAATGAALAQTRPAFEAASVKPNTTGAMGSRSNGSEGQVVMSNQTLKRLIERAYSVKPFQVIGPSWMEDVRFDIAAKYPPDTKYEDRPLMLRTLLEDRFKLAAHLESREAPGYALVTAKGGSKLKPVEPGADGVDSKGSGRTEDFVARKVSMAKLADEMARFVGVAVIDGTAMEGVYDVELHWTLDPLEAKTREEADAALFAAIQDALGKVGLHLRAQKVPVAVVVVDHAERVPSEN